MPRMARQKERASRAGAAEAVAGPLRPSERALAPKKRRAGAGTDRAACAVRRGVVTVVTRASASVPLSDLLSAGVAAAALALLGSSPCAGGGVHSPPHRQADGHGWTGAASAPFARHRKPVLRRRSLQLPRPTCGQSTLWVLVAARVLQVGRACALRVELLWSRMCKPAGSLSFLSPRGRPCAGALMNMPGSQS